MAGHSKWANIKRRKEKVDAKRGKIFSRIAKEIISAVKQGGGADPKSNSKLRLAIEKAKGANFPADNIERNIKKASLTDQQDYFEMTYELYGHGGVGIIVEIMSDNRNRTASDIRIAINKKGGTIATPGAVTFQFDRKGVLRLNSDRGDQEALFEAAIEAGAEDIQSAEEETIVLTSVDILYEVKVILEKKGFKIEESSFEMFPHNLIECDEETRKKNEELIDWLEALDDVDAVFSNMG